MVTNKRGKSTTEHDSSANVLDQFPNETSAHKSTRNDSPFPMRAKTIIVGAIMCGGVALGVSTLVWSRASATETGTGSLTVQSEPAGASVFIDGNARGKTPLSLALVAGKHQLALRHGQRSQDFSVTITANVATVHHVTWPPDTQEGGLQVISDGAPGTVALDGTARGTTPLTIRNLTAGDHEVVFRSDTETQRRTIRIEPGGMVSLVIAPTGAAKGVTSGWLTVRTATPLQIFEDEKLVGSTESERVMFSAGEHTFTFVSSALGFSVTRKVNVAAGGIATVPIALPRAALSVNATPWAQVWLDGESIGETPIGTLTTTIGAHELIFRHPQLGEKRVTTLVTLKEPARVGVDMRASQ